MSDLREQLDYRCELTDVRPGQGRCARGGRTVDQHHIKYRSHGGTDEDENILIVCRHHHDQIHNNQMAGPYRDTALGAGPKTFWAYTEGGERVRLYVWRELAEELEGQAIQTHQTICALLAERDRTTWSLAAALAHVESYTLYNLLGFDTLSEYAMSIGRSHEWCRKLIRAHGYLMQLPEAERDMFTSLPTRLMAEAGGSIIRLDFLDRTGLVQMATEHGAPTPEIIERARELARAPGTSVFRKYQVTITFNGAAVMEVSARNEQDATEKAVRNLQGYKPLRGGVEIIKTSTLEE